MVKDKDYITVRGLPSFYIKRWELKTNPSPSIKHTCTNHGAQCWYSHMIKRMKLHRLFLFPCRKMHLAAAKSKLGTNSHILFCSLCFCQPPLLIFFLKKLLFSTLSCVNVQSSSHGPTSLHREQEVRYRYIGFQWSPLYSKNRNIYIFSCH